MESIIKEHLERMQFGKIQLRNHVAVIPIIGGNGSGPDYLTMKEAMAESFIIVAEMTEGGQVPELKVINLADKPVLFLDGEELAGAKQNRVLNTTILIKEKSETAIPVSCTEHGRWSYNSSHFKESGHIMSARLRSVKNASVSQNLKSERSFRSDQGAVWDNIAAQATVNKVSTPTGAMRDVLEARQEDLDVFLEHFPVVQNQKGLIVLVNGEVVGLDSVSKTAAYASLHPKLIRSYVMDALTEKPAKRKDATREKADAFLKKILRCNVQEFDSLGYGRDYRYEGQTLVGSALIHENALIHMAFFQSRETETAGRMSSVAGRRAPRQTSTHPNHDEGIVRNRRIRLHKPPIYRSYWVIPGRLLAGFFPGSKDPVQEGANLEALISSGIRHVINLMEPDERDHQENPFIPYHEKLRDLAASKGIEVFWERIPIRDQSVPSKDGMVMILDRIDQSLARQRPVYVHCWGGKGRTGTVVGCFLARHGIAVGDAALEKIRELRRNDPNAHEGSPETDAQRDLVRCWKPQE